MSGKQRTKDATEHVREAKDRARLAVAELANVAHMVAAQLDAELLARTKKEEREVEQRALLDQPNAEALVERIQALTRELEIAANRLMNAESKLKLVGPLLAQYESAARDVVHEWRVSWSGDAPMRALDHALARLAEVRQDGVLPARIRRNNQHTRTQRRKSVRWTDAWVRLMAGEEL